MNNSTVKLPSLVLIVAILLGIFGRVVVIFQLLSCGKITNLHRAEIRERNSFESIRQFDKIWPTMSNVPCPMSN